MVLHFPAALVMARRIYLRGPPRPPFVDFEFFEFAAGARAFLFIPAIASGFVALRGLKKLTSIKEGGRGAGWKLLTCQVSAATSSLVPQQVS
jgi:hypothetical protein